VGRYCTEVRLDTPISQCESELIEEGFISTAKSAVDNMVTQAATPIVVVCWDGSLYIAPVAGDDQPADEPAKHYVSWDIPAIEGRVSVHVLDPNYSRGEFGTL